MGFNRDEDGNRIFKLSAPSEDDGKPNVTVTPFTEGLFHAESSCGDDLDGMTILRRQGTQLHLSWTDNDAQPTKEVWVTFHEMVEMHDGHLVHIPTTEWGFSDLFSVGMRMPATPCQANGSGTGNADKVSLGDGANLIVPAAGDGDWDVELGSESVLPTIVAIRDEGNGYWDYDQWNDELTPSTTPGYADWQLFDFQLGPYWMCRNDDCADPRGIWELDPYKVEPIRPRWQFGLKCKRTGSSSRNAAEIGGRYIAFREDIT